MFSSTQLTWLDLEQKKNSWLSPFPAFTLSSSSWCGPRIPTMTGSTSRSTDPLLLITLAGKRSKICWVEKTWLGTSKSNSTMSMATARRRCSPPPGREVPKTAHYLRTQSTLPTGAIPTAGSDMTFTPDSRDFWTLGLDRLVDFLLE